MVTWVIVGTQCCATIISDHGAKWPTLCGTMNKLQDVGVLHKAHLTNLVLYKMKYENRINVESHLRL